MSARKLLVIVVWTLALACPGMTQIPGHAFRYERAILPGGAGPNRLEIDVSLLTAAGPFREFSRMPSGSEQPTMTVAHNGLTDLRIYDPSGKEVPYLLIAPQAAPVPKWVQARLLPVAATRKTSGFEADLGKLFTIDSWRMNGIPGPFMKRVRLEGSGDRSRWTVLAEEATVFDLPAENLKQLEIEFDSGAYRYLRITWDDSASAGVPVPVDGAARLSTSDTLQPAIRIPLTFEKRDSEPGISRYRLRLPGRHLPVTAIELTSPQGNVLRRARVSESRLGQGEMKPEMLGIASLWHSIRAREGSAELRVPIDPPREPVLDLTVNDGNNPPLDITGISAVLAYLPWIYFEASSKEPLTARFGAPGLARPAYDLEAMRDSAAKMRTSHAHWGEFHKPDLGPEAGALLAGAEIDIKSFRYLRPIPGGRIGLNALMLDSEVLGHSNLNDLRIAGPDGRQVPYVLEKLEEPLGVSLPPPAKLAAPARRSSSDPSVGRQSLYRLALPNANLPPARLVLTTSARIFRRTVRVVVEKNPANERQEPWSHEIAASIWAHADTGRPAPRLVLQLPTLGTAETRVVVDEGDNSPLPLDSAILLLPCYRLRFFRQDNAALKLCYGNSILDAPQYDIGLLEAKLVGAEAAEISLAAVNPSDGNQPQSASIQKILFWIVLVSAVIVLLALIVRLLR